MSIDKVIIDPNELIEPNKIQIKTGITNHTFSDINSMDSSIKLNFELYFSYDLQSVLKILKKSKEDFRLPFHIQNAISIDTINYWVNDTKCNGKIIRFEKYNIICELSIINFISLSPFNTALIPIKVITNGCYGTENLQFISDLDIVWGVKKNINFLTCNTWGKNGYVIPSYINPNYDNKQKIYSRIYFVLIYNFSALIDVVKYYFIPTILTIILTIFYDIDQSSFASLFSTLVLGDIALLFILPTKNQFSRSEKSICINILLILIVTIIKLTKLNISILILSTIMGAINLLNIIYDVISTHIIKQKYLEILNADYACIDQLIDQLSYHPIGSVSSVKTINKFEDLSYSKNSNTLDMINTNESTLV